MSSQVHLNHYTVLQLLKHPECKWSAAQHNAPWFFYLRVFVEPLSKCHAILTVTVHSQGKSLNALNEHERTYNRDSQQPLACHSVQIH